MVFDERRAMYIFVTGLLIFVLSAYYCLWKLSFRPSRKEKVQVYRKRYNKSYTAEGGLLQKKLFSILTFNVQYFAGTEYCFWYDTLDGSGKDVRPSEHSVRNTMASFVAYVEKYKPDFICLQECDRNSRRTGYIDQVRDIFYALSDEYRYLAYAPYWKSPFVPHPNVWGSVDVNLVIISRYTLRDSFRHQLPMQPMNPVKSLFFFRRAILEVRVPVYEGKDLIILNLHLSSFAQGCRAMEKQVKMIRRLIQKYSDEGHKVVCVGDFNLLPPGMYDCVNQATQMEYRSESELIPLLGEFECVPPAGVLATKRWEKCLTFYPNWKEQDPRILDYLFFTGMKMKKYTVDQSVDLSDHKPILTEFKL